MLIATNEKHNLQIQVSGLGRSALFRSGNGNSPPIIERRVSRRLSLSGLIASNNRVNHLVRFIYFLNAAIVLAGLGIITAMQGQGEYRCKTISVQFDEVVWEHANVRLPDDTIGDPRLLIYSYFSGVYQGW